MFLALQFFAACALFLAVFGTIGNIIIIIVTSRIKNENTFIFIRFLAVSDLFTPFYWNLHNFLYTFFDIDYENLSLYVCKIGMFVQFSSLQYSAWMLVIMSLDRYFTVRIATWKTSYLTATRATALGYILFALIFLLQSNVLFTFGYEKTVNNSIEILCYHSENLESTKWMSTWGSTHSFLYSYIPFSLLLIINCLFLHHLYTIHKTTEISAKNKSIKKKKSSANKTVISLTVLFILMTSPLAVVANYYTLLIQTYSGKLIISIGDCLSFSFHCCSIVILMITNKRFYREMKALFCASNLDIDHRSEYFRASTALLNNNNNNNNTNENTNIKFNNSNINLTVLASN